MGVESTDAGGPADRSSPKTMRLGDLTPAQWKSGVAAWLGWMFDGLDMHLYTLVALPFVASLLRLPQDDSRVGSCSAWIQAAFLVGWAVGGGLFGRLGDRIGRTRALMLTILVYAACTGLSYVAQSWQQLLVFRFLAALGIGGEWAVGASLLAETWPRKWGPWVSAVLQTSGNLGVLLAGAAYYLVVQAAWPDRSVFLVGVLPALLVFWIRRAVPESPEWEAARRRSTGAGPRVMDLFRGSVRRTTLLTMTMCATALTAHWGFLFWYLQHLRGVAAASAATGLQTGTLVSKAMMWVMLFSIGGNFIAAAVAYRFGFRRTIVGLCAAYGVSMTVCYAVPRAPGELWAFFALIGLCHGLFAMFALYLPPLFPTLLRTTGAGLCYNVGRLAAAAGTVLFGRVATISDFRPALLCAGFLFLPAAFAAAFLPEGATAEAADTLGSSDA